MRRAGIDAGDDWLGSALLTGEVTARRPVLNGGDLFGYAEVSIREQPHLARALMLFVFCGRWCLAPWCWADGAVRADRRRITQPLALAEVTRKIRDTGEFTHRVPTTGVTEVQRLRKTSMRCLM